MLSMPESQLRRRRLECGLTQAELAARAGVSRQLVAAVEAARNVPAVEAALALAQALSATVEELFSAPSAPVLAALGGRLRDGVALRVGRVGDQLVAAELADHGVAGASWAKSDGVLDAGELRLFPGARLEIGDPAELDTGQRGEHGVGVAGGLFGLTRQG